MTAPVKYDRQPSTLATIISVFWLLRSPMTNRAKKRSFRANDEHQATPAYLLPKKAEIYIPVVICLVMTF